MLANAAGAVLWAAALLMTATATFDLVRILLCQFFRQQGVVWKDFLAFLQVAFAKLWAEFGAAYLWVLLATGLAVANEFALLLR